MTENNEQVKELETQALTFPERAKQLKVTDDEQYQTAGRLLVEIKGLRKKIQETFLPMKRAALKAHREIIKQEKQADKPLVTAEAVIKPAMGEYQAEQERKRREEEERLRKEEERRRIEKAAELEKQGESEQAQETLNAVEPPVQAKEPVKSEGISTRSVWKFALEDPAKLPRKYLQPDEKKIRQVVRALKGEAVIPGVKVWEEKTIAARS